MKIFNILSGYNKQFKEYRKIIEKIDALENKYSAKSDEEIKEEAKKLKEAIQSKKVEMKNILPDAFAMVKEASQRTLHQKHYDVQLMGGIAIFEGKIVEMKTGEGKTLAATSPIFLRALLGKGAHVITVNDYLAQRDAVWMGQIHHFLGLSVSCIVHDNSFMYDPTWKIPPKKLEEEDKERDEFGSFKIEKDFLRPITRKEAYSADITYGTNTEFGFDYLRDNLAYSKNDQVQRGFYFAVIDEADSALIDEARTPLIISAPNQQTAEYYKLFARITSDLEKDKDYEVDEKDKTIQITNDGIDKVQKMLNIDNIYSSENMSLVHYLDESLKAKALFNKDKQYVVKDDEIIIVDEFTGRLMPGRRYSGGLHQAIEAKENVEIKEESKTFAQITIQNYFHMYKMTPGMTGTAKTSEEEFRKVYGLDVVEIPTNKPMIREDAPDLIFKTTNAKYDAVVKEIKERNEKGQPMLIGTTSINENELLSKMLSNAGVKHEILNAKDHEREGEIIAQTGRFGAVTLATNMAGRGVDIVLGGNPQDKQEAEKIRSLGGLLVIGTQRNESRRVDNQLRGRAGRQGDPGITMFFLSLEDDLLRIFGGDRIKAMMTKFNLPEDQPIQSKLIIKVINEAQKKVEGINFDIRKQLLEYDNVLDKQRNSVYRRRQHILEKTEKGELEEVLKGTVLDIISNNLKNYNMEDGRTIEEKRNSLIESLSRLSLITSSFATSLTKNQNEDDTARKFISELESGNIPDVIESRIKIASQDKSNGMKILNAIDMLWTDHLDNLEALLEAVRMRAYGQRDPLVEYKKDSYDMFLGLMMNAEEMAISIIFKEIDTNPTNEKLSSLQNKDVTNTTPIQTAVPTELLETKQEGLISEKDTSVKKDKIGRNDPCWCGSGKKYKKCHGM